MINVKTEFSVRETNININFKIKYYCKSKRKKFLKKKINKNYMKHQAPPLPLYDDIL